MEVSELSFDEVESAKEVVTKAIKLRNYLLFVKDVNFEPLERELAKLRESNGHNDIDLNSADFGAIRKAFSEAVSASREHVDQITLEKVLLGQYKAHQNRYTPSNLIVFFFGFVFILILIHYFYLAASIRTTVQDVENFLSFDHKAKLDSAIGLIRQSDEITNRSEDLSKVAHEIIARDLSDIIEQLEVHYGQEMILASRMEDLIKSAQFGDLDDVVDYLALMLKSINNPSRDSVSDTKSASERLAEESFLSEKSDFMNQPEPLAVPSVAEVSPGLDLLRGLYSGRLEVMEMANRWVGNYYSDSRLAYETRLFQLKRTLTPIENMILPFLFGVFGSFVYCMIRIIGFATAPLDLMHTALRCAFAGISALVLAMVFVPSNSIDTGLGLGQPIIYMFSFIFGYSIESFTRFLSKMNSALQANLTIRRAKSGE